MQFTNFKVQSFDIVSFVWRGLLLARFRRTNPFAPQRLWRSNSLQKTNCNSAPQRATSPGGSGRSVAWLARLFRVQEVVSSNLTAPTTFLPCIVAPSARLASDGLLPAFCSFFARSPCSYIARMQLTFCLPDTARFHSASMPSLAAKSSSSQANHWTRQQSSFGTALSRLWERTLPFLPMPASGT